MAFRGKIKEGYLRSRGYAAPSLRFTKSLRRSRRIYTDDAFLTYRMEMLPPSGNSKANCFIN
jgi:hypothetical protein